MTVSNENSIVKASIGELLEQFDDVAEEVLFQAAELVVGYAKIYVPVDTGSLRDSIRVERGGLGKRWREVRVRAGGYITNPRSGKLVDYAGYVEQKQPYLWPALLTVVDDLLLLLQSDLEKVEGVEFVSIEGTGVVVHIGAETEGAVQDINRLERAGTAAARAVKRATGDENVSRIATTGQRIIGVLNQIELAARSAQLALMSPTPLGAVILGGTLLGVASTIGMQTDSMMSMGE